MDTLKADKSLSSTSAAMPAPIITWQSQPVVWWAIVGILFMAITLYFMGKWVMSPEFARTLPPPVGEDYGLGRLYFVRCFEVVLIIGMVWVLRHYVWLPYKQQGRLTSDGMAVLAIIPLFFQDPFLNYSAPWFSYSSVFFNYGNWVGQVPGALTPNVSVVPEPILIQLPGYATLVAIPILIIVEVMRVWKRRYPGSGPIVIFGVGIVGGLIYDFIVEGAACFFGLWSFWGSIQSLCIFGGHYYQFPVYEPLMWGTYSGVVANLIYWKNDKGEMYSEHGVERLKISPAKKQVLRYFAMFGLFSVLFLPLYNIPAQWFGTHGDPMPADTPMHLRNGICGEGTPFVCPGPGVPINRGAEGYIVTPQMTLEKAQP